MTGNKTKPTEVSVSAFVDALLDEGKRMDAKTLIALMKAVTGEKPKMWGPSIIGFGSYHYTYESGRQGDMLLTGFSPRKPAFVLYNAFGFTGAEEWLPKLGKHTTGKGCLYIKKLSDVNAEVLHEMVARSVAAVRLRHPNG